MLYYPAKIESDGNDFMVSFRDIPEALTSGSSLDEARFMAADALQTAMDFYFEDHRAVPPPSPAAKDEELISLPASVTAKVLLLNEMLQQGITPTELARRMGVHKQEMTRIMDLHHATKIDTVAAGLMAMGKILSLTIK